MDEQISKDVADLLARMRVEFVARLPARLAGLEEALQALARGEAPALHELHRAAHTLVGAAGVHQLMTLSAAARALEQAAAALPQDAVPDAAAQVRLRDLLARVTDAAQQPQAETAPDTAPAAPRGGPPCVAVVGGDAAQRDWLRVLLEEAGYRVQVCADLEALRASARPDDLPAAIVIDAASAPDDATLAHALRELKLGALPGLPILFTSARHDMPARLAAYRAGATHYLTRPLQREAVLRVLADAAAQRPAEPYRVLLVDDDPVQLTAHAHILRQAGMAVREVSDPLQALRALDDFDAELMLLDLHMPECSGPELAAILRDEPRHTEVPVLYLSAETNVTLQLVALDRGGEHFLSKPVEPRHLVAAVSLHARRLRQARAQGETLRETLYERERQQTALDEHAIVSVTDAQGVIRHANDKFCLLSGYARAQLVGQNHRIVKSDQHEPAFYAELWQTLRAGRVWQGEVCNRAHNGALYWLEATIVPFVDAQGQPYRYVSVGTDITRLKQVEHDLLQARDVVEAASRAKSEFLASMSHELRTPLNAIIGFSQIFGLDPKLDEETRGHAREIEGAGSHLLLLVNDLIDLARIESGQLQLSQEAVPLDSVLTESLSMVVPIASKHGIALAPVLDGAARVTVRADYVRLRQVIINLLSNAIKYNRPQGSVRLLCEARPEQRVRISVIDTGVGIAADKRGRIFNAFDRLGAERGSVEGTGIGLVLTKRMVDAMGGSIDFSSIEGQGSTFWVELPRASAPDVPAAEATGVAPAQAAAPAAEAGRGPRVLYVEDNPINLRLMRQIFARRPQLELCEATTAGAGLEQARAQPPALILLDINLPDMSGYEALAQLRADARTAAIPVLAVTANAMLGDSERGLAAGFTAYLTKPINVAKFLELLDRELATRPH